MNEHVEVPFGLYFPAVVVDSDGRRVRPGNVVQFLDNGLERRAHVQGWHTDGLVLVTVDDDPIEPLSLTMKHPSEVRRADVEYEDAATRSNFYVEVSGPSTVLVQCVGTRDLIGVDIDSDQRILPALSDFSVEDISGTQVRSAVRPWATSVLHLLSVLPAEERYEVIRRELRAPILERVLQEAVLPRTLQRVVLVATNQSGESPMDTSPTAAVLRMWLEAHGHMVGVGEPDQSRRWIRELEIVEISALPHVIEAVVFFVKSHIPQWVKGADRVVVVHGGGTPAMNVGVLVAASQYADVFVRHVQVPEPDPVTKVPQSLIEMDLGDMPELGHALS